MVVVLVVMTDFIETTEQRMLQKMSTEWPLEREEEKSP